MVSADHEPDAGYISHGPNTEFDSDSHSNVGEINQSDFDFINSKEGSIHRLSSMKFIWPRLANSNIVRPPRREVKLEKYNPTQFKLVFWQPRHLEVNGGMFRWSTEDEAGNLVQKGVLNLDLYQCFVEQAENKSQFKVTINGNSREFWFRC